MSEDSNKVVVLLSTYNGQDYLCDLLDSLLSQSYKNFILLIRDDGSLDNTPEILKCYKDCFVQCSILESNINVGIKKSFDFLLNYALNNFTADYFMFADQDDVWLEDKIEKTLNIMEENVNKVDRNFPVLIHTDLLVVDQYLKLLSKSFWDFQHLNPSRIELNRLLVQNVITGCTMMINRPLANISLAIPDSSVMHDWWIGIVASAFGQIDYLPEPTIMYRQHIKNNVGAKKYNLKYIFSQLLKPYDSTFIMNQAECFLRNHKSRLHPSQEQILNKFISLKKQSRFKRMYIIIRYKFLKQGWLRTLGFLLRMKQLN